METEILQQKIGEFIANNREMSSVKCTIDNKKRIITLRGHVHLRGEQIKIEEEVAKLARSFDVVNLVKVTSSAAMH